MATFGVDFYALTKYGMPVPAPDFEIEPFRTVPWGHTSIRLLWEHPTKPFVNMAVVRNKFGPATSISDGDIIFSQGEPDVRSHEDWGVAPGVIYYYTMFIEDGTGTWRAGFTQGLSIGDHKFGELMWNRTPYFFRYNGRELATIDLSEENAHLRKLLNVFGYGFDILKTRYDILNELTNPYKAPIDAVENMGSMLGIEWHHTIAAESMRKVVSNNGITALAKGTSAGLRQQVRDATGWDIDLKISRNILLNDDQSRASTPSYPYWRSSMRYPVGARVSFNSRYYEARVASPRGTEPTGGDSDNTSWKWLTGQTAEFLDPRTNGVSTWWSSQPWAKIGLRVGVPNYADPTTNANNSMTLTLTPGGVSKEAYIWSLKDGATRQEIMTSAIPLETTDPFDSTRTYTPGSACEYDGKLYRAVYHSQGIEPVDSKRWEQISTSTKKNLVLWSYVHGQYEPPIDVNFAPGLSSHLRLFDAYGTMIFDSSNPALNHPLGAGVLRTNNFQVVAPQGLVTTGYDVPAYLPCGSLWSGIPKEAVYATMGFLVSVKNNTYTYVDAMHMAYSGTNDYEPPRAIGARILPARINYFPWPSPKQTGTTGWTTMSPGVTISTAGA